MPLAIAIDSDTIVQALKILEPYTKGARAWFEDSDEAWVKGTLIQRTDDEAVGVGRLVFVRDDTVASTTAQIIAKTASPPPPAARVLASATSSDSPQSATSAGTPDTPLGSAIASRHRKPSVRAAATPDELKRIVARGSRLTGGRISSMQRVDDSYVIDISFAELAEPGADAELLPPLCNPPILDCTPDLTTLSYLHEPAVLYNLRRRYEQRLIYTYSGVVLVAMNPFDPVPVYSPEYMARYARKEPGHEEPHLFAIAENAYKGMVSDQRDQTIIVYGESGSGKTTSAKYIMRYFAQAHHADTNDKQMSTVESQILATNPVFESFGNAKTTRNDNSSRFGKFLDIKFERGLRQKIVGGRIRTFLLERSRVAYQPPTERNYHIFYQLLAGAPDDLRSELRLDGEFASWQAFHYTRQGGDGTIAGVNDAEDFTVTDASLGMVGIGREQRSAIWRTLSGILHLGNVTFSGTETTGSYVDSPAEAEFAIAASLLGVEEHRLRQWLTKRQIVTRHDHILAKVNKTQALVIRDSIAKFIYSRLFDWILGPINASLLPTEVDEQSTRFVGVLDIYGFEHFDQNSFEQFCINYANEKLQQNFNHHVFKLEQEEYRREQLENWTFIGFQDNQPCIDLIEGKPIGILSLLDEESRLEQGSDRTFTEKLYRQFIDSSGSVGSGSGTSAVHGKRGAAPLTTQAADTSYFRKPRFSNTAFTIRHYAHDVTYEGDGFLEKNKDTVPDEILELLCSSSFSFLGDLAAAAAAAAAAGRETASPRIGASAIGGGPRAAVGGSSAAGILRRQAPTLAAVFRRSLSGLMATLAETEMHYIRCIKPNEAKTAWRLQAPMVLSQLRSCGVIETIRISKAGYPSRVPVLTFNERYSVLLGAADAKLGGGATLAGPGSSSKAGDAPTRAEHQLCTRILEFCLPDSGQYQVGLTKVFFRAGQWAIMEKKRSSLFDASAVAIQRLGRGALVRQGVARIVSAVTTLQRWFRARRDARLVANLRVRHAVRVIECAWSARCAQRCRRQLELAAVHSMQTLARAYLARCRVARIRDHRRALMKNDSSKTHIKHAAGIGPTTAPASSVRAAPPMLRSDSEVVNEAFARLTLSSPTDVLPAPISPAAFSSFADLRRISSQSSEAARQRTAEARASLLAAGVAERNAEAELPPPVFSAYNSSARFSPQTAVPSPHSTFGVRDGLSAQRNAGGTASVSSSSPSGYHSKGDSLTIGDDIYALINEFSLDAGGRYGEVDARSLRNRDQHLASRNDPSHSPALSVNCPPSMPPATNRLMSMPTKLPQAALSAQLFEHSGAAGSLTPLPGGGPRSWLHEALGNEDVHSVDSDELTAISPGYVNVVIDRSPLMAPTVPQSASNERMRYRPHHLPVQLRPPHNYQQQQPQQPHSAHHYPLSPAVEKRDSQSNSSIKSAKTSLAELGGRHTAARARAWATKQKDRVFSAFSSSSSTDRALRKAQNSPDPRSIILPDSSDNGPYGNDQSFYNHALDPPPALRFHHHSHSATNILGSNGRSARPSSTDSLR